MKAKREVTLFFLNFFKKHKLWLFIGLSILSCSMTNYQKEGKVFYLKENYDKALDYFYKALKKQEASDILLYNEIGNCYYQKKEYTKALENYSKSISQINDYVLKQDRRILQPDVVFFNRGVCYSQINERLKAISDFEKAILIHYKEPKYHLALGTEYLKIENYDKAIEYLKNTLESEGKNHIACKNLGIAYYKKNDLYNSLEIWKKGVGLDTNDYEIMLYLGEANGKLGMTDEAIEWYENYFKFSKDYEKHYIPYINLGYQYAKKENYDKAILNYKKSISYNSKYHEAYFHLAVLYDKHKDKVNCIENMKKAAYYGNKEAQNYLNEINIKW